MASAKAHKSKRSKPQHLRSSHYRWRLVVAGAWCALILLLLFMVGKWVLQRSTASGGHTPADAQLAQLTQVLLPHGQQGQVVQYSAFKVIYDNRRHVPWCVAYVLTAEHAQTQMGRLGNFAPDSAVAGCAQPDDYTGSGYQRGHMAPVADMSWSRQAMEESFLMTNISPQRKSLNEGGWSKLEEKVREWAVRDGVLIVITGPVLTQGDPAIGPAGRRIAVPGRYFKALLAPGVQQPRAIAFIYPNGRAAGPLSDYAVSVDEAERLTGLDLFSALPDDEEQLLERQCNLQAWLTATR